MFTRFAWGVLIYNVFVILWGAMVRATGAGAGCGNHWPLCNGEVVPPSPGIKTIIEFGHRTTSGLALILVLVLCVWAFRAFSKGDRVRKFASLSLFFILIEALLGAGLVLLDYVDQNKSIGRAFYLSAHLINTQVLLAMLALTAWYSKRRPVVPLDRRVLPALGATLVVGVSGAIAALGDTLFPATSFAEGVRQEMSTTAHFLLRLRIAHPLLSVLGGLYVALVAIAVKKTTGSPAAVRFAFWTLGLVFIQLVSGAINVLLLAPVWMQLVHLFLADAMWVVIVLLAAEGQVGREASPVTAPAGFRRSPA